MILSFQPVRTFVAWTLLMAMLAALNIGCTRRVSLSPRYDVDVQTGIVYAAGYVEPMGGVPGTMPLTLDVYSPINHPRDDKPAVILVHGGAFTGGHSSDLQLLANHLAQRGWVCFSINYRLIPDGVPAGNPIRASVVDTKAAIRWVRAHAPLYGIDPASIALAGNSAGSVAVMTTGISDTTQWRDDFTSDSSVLPLHPFNTPGESSWVRAVVGLWGGVYQYDWIDADDPQLLIIHGTDDPIVPLERAHKIRERAEAVGMPFKLIEVQGGGHEPWLWETGGPSVIEMIREYLDDVQVKNPKPYLRLKTQAEGEGQIELIPGGQYYPPGTEVRARAVSAPGFRFTGWRDAPDIQSDTRTITLDADQIITAAFQPDPDPDLVEIEFVIGDGGKVELDPPRREHPRGAIIKAWAKPAPGFRFDRWVGGLAGAPNPAMIRAEEGLKLEAIFVPAAVEEEYGLDVIADSKGKVELHPEGQIYKMNTIVEAMARPAYGFTFGFWAGDTHDFAPQAEILMAGPRRIEPVFLPDPHVPRYQLNALVQGEGSVVVQPARERFLPTEPITLLARPAPGWRFVRWESEALIGRIDDPTQNPFELRIESDRSITAVFEQAIRLDPPTLQLDSTSQTVPVAVKTDPPMQWALHPLWGSRWLGIETPNPQEMLVTTEANNAPYARAAFFRLDPADETVRPPVIQLKQNPAMDAWPRTPKPTERSYAGPQADSLLAWSADARAATDTILEATQTGALTIGRLGGTAIGYLSTDGQTPLTVPDDGEDYHLFVTWRLPENPTAAESPTVPGNFQPAYLYFGIDSGAIDRQKLRWGVEWGDRGRGPEWIVRGQRQTREYSAKQLNNGIAPQVVRFHIWEDQDGDTIMRQGAPAIIAEVSLDGGPWHRIHSEVGPVFPHAAMHYDQGEDYLTFKVRGLGAEQLTELRWVKGSPE